MTTCLTEHTQLSAAFRYYFCLIHSTVWETNGALINTTHINTYCKARICFHTFYETAFDVYGRHVLEIRAFSSSYIVVQVCH